MTVTQIVTVTVTEETTWVSGSFVGVTLVTVICGHSLTPVMICSGAGYLCLEGKEGGAERVVAKSSDSALKPVPVESWDRVRVMKALSQMTLRGPREPPAAPILDLASAPFQVERDAVHAPPLTTSLPRPIVEDVSEV